MLDDVWSLVFASALGNAALLDCKLGDFAIKRANIIHVDMVVNLHKYEVIVRSCLQDVAMDDLGGFKVEYVDRLRVTITVQDHIRLGP